MLTVHFHQLNLPAEAVILDLGCGEGRHALGLRHEYPEATVIGVDLDRKSLQLAKQKLPEVDQLSNAKKTKSTCQFIQGDGAQLSFKDNSFDAIICSEVLEHIPCYELFLKEIKRLLKPGGKLAISVPRAWPERICWLLSKEYYSVPGGHIRIFNAKQLKTEITQYGFRFTAKHWSHALHVPYWWLQCALWSRRNTHYLIKLYHRLLVWDLLQKPLLTRLIEKCLNPIMGKSVVLYFDHRDN